MSKTNELENAPWPNFVKEIKQLKKLDRLIRHLEKIEQWEARLISDNSCWDGGLPVLTDDLFKEWMELQKERNKLLER